MNRLFSPSFLYAFLYDSRFSDLMQTSSLLNILIGMAVLGICAFFVVAHIRFVGRKRKQQKENK